jgi:hypothetical protein
MAARARSATAARSGRRSSETAGAIWAAAGTPVKVEVFTDGARQVELRVLDPDQAGAKSTTAAHHDASGPAANAAPLTLEFTAAREGYHQLIGRLAEAAEAPTRAYVKVEYEAPAESGKFWGGSGDNRAECQIGALPAGGCGIGAISDPPYRLGRVRPAGSTPWQRLRAATVYDRFDRGFGTADLRYARVLLGVPR